MPKRRIRQAAAFASLALVLTAAAVSTSDRWNFDFAQYKGTPRPQAQDEFRFVIVGDRTGGAQWGLMPQTFREINLLDPDFVISVGDLIDGYGDDEETVNGIWEEFDKTEMPVLRVPFVYAPGNHDIFNAASGRVYEKRYGPRFKSFNYRGLHFITLNTEENAYGDFRFGRRGGADVLGDEQQKWLKEDIERNRHARRMLIFMHQPIWKYSGLNSIYPLLEGLRVNIFAGHWHKYSYEEIRGIPHIICSATAAFIPEEGMEAYGRFRSYLMATVRDDDFKLALIRLGGVMNTKQLMEQDQGAIRQLADATAILRDGDGPTAPTRIVFRNPMPMPVRLQIARATRGSSKYLFDKEEPSTDQGAILQKEIDWASFAGRALGNVEYRVLYRFQNSGGEPQTVDFPIEAKVHRTVQAMAISAPPTIDGDLSEWSGAKWQSISEPSQATIGSDAWQGPQDLSAQFTVTQDEKNIYLAVRVLDDTVAYSGSTHDGDSVEIYTADADDRKISFSREYHRETDWRRLIVAPFSGGDSKEAGASSGAARLRKFGQRGMWDGEAQTQDFNGGQAAYVRDPEHHQYVLEIALPRSELGWDDRSDTVNELDIAINDRDSGPRRETQLTWSGNERNAYSSRYYGMVKLPTP